MLSGGKVSRGFLKLSSPLNLLLPFLSKALIAITAQEFMNWTILKHFQTASARLIIPRSREYQKNDNAHIEGKNWTHIRQYLGYDRFEDQRMRSLLNDLYYFPMEHAFQLLLAFCQAPCQRTYQIQDY